MDMDRSCSTKDDLFAANGLVFTSKTPYAELQKPKLEAWEPGLDNHGSICY